MEESDIKGFYAVNQRIAQYKEAVELLREAIVVFVQPMGRTQLRSEERAWLERVDSLLARAA